MALGEEEILEPSLSVDLSVELRHAHTHQDRSGYADQNYGDSQLLCAPKLPLHDYTGDSPGQHRESHDIDDERPEKAMIWVR